MKFVFLMVVVFSGLLVLTVLVSHLLRTKKNKLHLFFVSVRISSTFIQIRKKNSGWQGKKAKTPKLGLPQTGMNDESKRIRNTFKVGLVFLRIPALA